MKTDFTQLDSEHAQGNAFMLPLAEKGKMLKVDFLNVTGEEQEQLISLGINSGVKLTVIAGSAEGALAVRVGDATLVLDKTLSRQIFVSEYN